MDAAKCNLHMSRGVMGLCDALTEFRALQAETEGDCHPDLDDVIVRLKDAAVLIPDEYWATCFAFNHVGMDEVAARLQAACREGVAA